jgi:hypothetical protein
MYFQDHDERVLSMYTGGPGCIWFQGLLMPYVKNHRLLECPSFSNPVYHAPAWAGVPNSTPGTSEPNSIRFQTGIGKNWFRNDGGRGLTVQLAENGLLRLDLSDGDTTDACESDPGLLTPGQWHHVSIIVDGGPKIVTWVIDGVLCDAGTRVPPGRYLLRITARAEGGSQSQTLATLMLR